MEIEKNKSIQSLNTFGLDARAEEYVEVHSIEDIEALTMTPGFGDKSRTIIGGGSNILITQDIPGIVIHNKIKGIEKVREDTQHVWVKVGAGEIWHDFVLHCIEHGIGGVENLSLIPGSVGAAPMQNIGAYGVELKDVFWELEGFSFDSQMRLIFNKPLCEFGYRSSIFKTRLKDKIFITSVTFRLSKEPKIDTSYGAIQGELEKSDVSEPSIKDVSDAVIRIRRAKLPDPTVTGNAGSFFKNPVIPIGQYEELKKKHPNIPHYPVDPTSVKVPAGWLIDQLGWKGKTIEGRYGVHKNQALVLVNYGGATGAEIYELSEQILRDVLKNFGIILEREVNIL